MRIGQYQISGISTRFWVILGVIIVLIAAIVILRPSGESDAEREALPAFPTAELKTTRLGWLDNTENLHTAASGEEIAGAYYTTDAGRGQVYRLRVYLPPAQAGEESRGDLYLTSPTTGYTFVGGTVLEPTQTYTADTLATEAEEQFTSARPVQLGFPSDRLPTLGEAYEITGMLWWNSFEVSRVPAESQTDVLSAPTFIVDRYQKLSPDELRAPSTHVTDTSFVFHEGPLEIRIPRLEWSSGNELRACVILRNLSTTPLSSWPEMLSSMSADIGAGSVTGQLTEFSPLGNGAPLESQQTVPSYMVFDGSVADPQQDLTLRMRTLPSNQRAASALNSLQLQVLPDNIQGVDQGQQQVNQCAANDTASTTAAGQAPAAVPADRTVPDQTSPSRDLLVPPAR
jgi:hypothetical protein